jgi:LPS-assembly protein
VESGPRATAGAELEALYPGGSIDLLVGQTYRLKPDSALASVSPLAGTAFAERSSDVVSRLTISFLPHFNISDRVDVDPRTGTFDRNEVYINAQYERSSLQVAYLRVPPAEELLGLGTREEVKGQALVNVWRNWLVYAMGQRDLATGDMIQEEFGFGYQDECFGISLSYLRQFTRFQDVPPSTAVYLRWSLKTSAEPESDTSIFPQHLYSGGAL